MPIIDYECRNGHITSKYIPASKCGSDHPESERARCRTCRCRAERVYSATGNNTTSIGFTDKSGRAPVVYLNTKTGEYSFPMHRDDPPDGPEYKRVAITSMKQYERVKASVDATCREEAQFKQEIEKEYFDKTSKSHREANRERVERAVRNGGYWAQHTDDKGVTRTRWAPVTSRAMMFLDIAERNADKRREEMRTQRSHSTANFHSRILELNESERSVVDGHAKRPELPDIKSLLAKYRRA